MVRLTTHYSNYPPIRRDVNQRWSQKHLPIVILPNLHFYSSSNNCVMRPFYCALDCKYTECICGFEARIWWFRICRPPKGEILCLSDSSVPRIKEKKRIVYLYRQI